MPEPIKRYSDVALTRLLRFWQKKLRLQDWNITIKYVPKDEMEDDSQGKNHYNDHARTSSIWILRPEDYDAETYPNQAQQDIEDTIVHELLHCHLAAWDVADNPAAEKFLEQAIETITGALVALKRRKA